MKPLDWPYKMQSIHLVHPCCHNVFQLAHSSDRPPLTIMVLLSLLSFSDFYFRMFSLFPFHIFIFIFMWESGFCLLWFLWWSKYQMWFQFGTLHSIKLWLLSGCSISYQWLNSRTHMLLSDEIEWIWRPIGHPQIGTYFDMQQGFFLKLRSLFAILFIEMIIIIRCHVSWLRL